MTGTAERLVTGDAANVAARLEQAAEPGTILIGDVTHDLVRSVVTAEPVDALTLKGKSEPVTAFRLLAVLGEPERRHSSIFVGRERELDAIAQAWARVGSDATCELLTVVGEPGVGKSRLVAEALASIGARVVRGRCVPYGDGITYWPVVEVVKQIGALPSDPAAASALGSLLGETDEATSADQIGWAFRKLVEEHAPLIVCARRHPVGRGNVPRPSRGDRAPRRGSDHAPVHGPLGAARAAPGLAGRDAAGAAHGGRGRAR